MPDLIIFIGVMAVILLGLFIFIMSKVGFSYSALSDYIKKVENKTVLQAASGIMVAMLIAAFFVFMIGQAAHADEIEWGYGGSVFIGLDYNKNGSVFCREGGVSNEVNSNLGANVGIVRYGNHSISGNYTHHSCALNPDVNTYDTPGFKYEWKIW